MHTAHPLGRKKISRILSRRRGAQAEAARRLGVKPVTICLWLKGQVQSQRIDAEMERYAAELTEKGK